MSNPFENTGTLSHNILTLTPRETAVAVQKGALYVDLRETGACACQLKPRNRLKK